MCLIMKTDEFVNTVWNQFEVINSTLLHPSINGGALHGRSGGNRVKLGIFPLHPIKTDRVSLLALACCKVT